MVLNIVFYLNRGNNKAKLPQRSLSPPSDLLITLRGGCVLQNTSSGGGRSCAAVHQRVQPLLRNLQDTVTVQLRYRHHQVVHWLLLNTTSHHYYLLVIFSNQDLSEPPEVRVTRLSLYYISQTRNNHLSPLISQSWLLTLIPPGISQKACGGCTARFPMALTVTVTQNLWI